MSGIRVQLVEAASGRAGFASDQARAEAVATGMRTSIFNVFFTPSRSEANYESPLQTRLPALRNSKKCVKNAKIADFSGGETVKSLPPNRINGLQQKTSQFRSFCETVKLCSPSGGPLACRQASLHSDHHV